MLIRFQEENERLLHYLDQSSKWQLIHTVEKQLLAEHLQSILVKGLDLLLEESRIADLRLMYNLVGRQGVLLIKLASLNLPLNVFLTLFNQLIMWPSFFRVKNGQGELCTKMAEYVKKRGKVRLTLHHFGSIQ